MQHHHATRRRAQALAWLPQWLAVVVSVWLLGACGGDTTASDRSAEAQRHDAVATADRKPAQRSTTDSLPDALSANDYYRRVERISDGTLKPRVVPWLAPDERQQFSSDTSAQKAFTGAIGRGDFAAADTVIASVPAQWHYALLDAADEQAFAEEARNDYAAAYRYRAYLHLNQPALWLLDAVPLEGQVLNADTGVPVTQATVVSGDPGFEQRVETDGTGQFRILVPSTNTPVLRIIKDGYRDQQIFDAPSGGSLLTLAREEQPLTVSLAADYPELTLRARLVDAKTGAPLVGMAVGAGFRDIDTGRSGTLLARVQTNAFGAITDDDGRLAIAALPTTDISLTGQLNAGGKLYFLQQDSVRFEDNVEIEIPVAEGAPIRDQWLIVTGVVRDQVSGAPIPNAQLTVEGSRNQRADAAGRFRVRLALGKDWSLSAGHTAYHPAEPQPFTSDAPKTIETEFVLDPITTGTVAGSVVNAATGDALSNAVVSVAGQSLRTNDDGRFVARNIEAGNLSVDATYAGFHPKVESIALKPLQTSDVTLALEPITTGTLTVRAVDASTGVPIAAADVRLSAKQAVTDATGIAVIDAVPGGRTPINVVAAKYAPASAEATVEAAGQTSIEVALTPITWGDISGTVIDAETEAVLEGAVVSAGAADAATSDDGAFNLTRIPAGTVVLHASVAGFLDETATVTLQAAGQVNVTLRLAPITWGRILGTVIDIETRQPLANATIRMGEQTYTSDGTGQFVAERVPAGEVTLVATAHSYESGSETTRLERNTDAELTLALVPIKTGDLLGRVQDAKTDEPIASARISIGGRATETDAGGNFRLDDIDIGRTTVTARHADYADGSVSAEVPAAEAVSVVLRLDLRREDVTNLESALAKDGTVDLYGIYFDSGKDQFKASSLSTLQAVRDVMQRAPTRRFQIAGHTDADGGEVYNQDLSERRAQTVINWLVANGIARQRLDAAGFGETRPAAPNDTESGKALNRRVQLRYADTDKALEIKRKP